MLIILLTPLPQAPVVRSADLVAFVASSVSRSSPPSLPDPGSAQSGPGPATVRVPNADGVVDLVSEPARPGEPPGSPPNPFRVRWSPPPRVREVPFALGAVLEGVRPDQSSVVVNGHVYGVGDTLEGLAIEAIGPEAIELRSSTCRARLPVQEAPLCLRLPL